LPLITGPFSGITKGMGHSLKNEGKKKDGLKVYLIIDAHSKTPEFVKTSKAKLHDKRFL
jgi:hypothetical protein